MWECTQKQFVYLRQKQGRDTHLQRSAGVLNEGRGKEAIQITSTGQSFRVFVYIWPVVSFFSLYPTGPSTLPKTPVQLFAKMDPTAEAWGGIPCFLWRVPPSFLTPREPSCSFLLPSVLPGHYTHARVQIGKCF